MATQLADHSSVYTGPAWYIHAEMMPPGGTENPYEQRQNFVMALPAASKANVVIDADGTRHVYYVAHISLDSMRFKDGDDIKWYDKSIPLMLHHKGGRFRYSAYAEPPARVPNPEREGYAILRFMGKPLWSLTLPYMLPANHFDADKPGPNWKSSGPNAEIECLLNNDEILKEEWEYVGKPRNLQMVMKNPRADGSLSPILKTTLDLQKVCIKDSKTHAPMTYFQGKRYGLRGVILEIEPSHIPKEFFDLPALPL